MPKNTTIEEYKSGENKYSPYETILDDYRIRCIKKPKDDIEYSIGKMIHYISKFLSSYRAARLKKKYKAKLKLQHSEDLKTKTLKIRDNQSSFRAQIKLTIEETEIE